MNPQPWPHAFHFLLLVLLPPFMALPPVFGYGSTSPIAAASGENGFFCAIDASGMQEIICWNKNNSESTSEMASSYVASLPPMASLSGGEGFKCGVTSNTSQAYCWQLSNPGTDLVPQAFKYNYYSQISAGMNHVCAIRGSYNSTLGYGLVDCWGFIETSSNSGNSILFPENDSLYLDPYEVVLNSIVSGDTFSCGVVKAGGIDCWGPKSDDLGVSAVSGNYETLASGKGSLCAISSVSGEVKCWGDDKEFGSPPSGVQFVALSASANYFCGIRQDDHGVECWGSIDESSVPKGYGFTAIASSDSTTCGVREVDLVLDCWGISGQSSPDYSPPLQLCSPGVCSPGSCANGSFVYNASILHEQGLTSLCVEKELKICLPCGSNCSGDFFPSSMCTDSADRICTACSLCQNSSCRAVCGLPSSEEQVQEQRKMKRLLIIVGFCVAGFLLGISGWCIIPRLIKWNNKRENRSWGISRLRNHCLRKQVVEADPDPSLEQPVVAIPPAGTAQVFCGTARVFRLSELKDATNGFKEFNELGRGSYGFVYKATLSDGSQVAVKRANATTIIHTNNRDFEAKVEILCNVRHSNIVNLIGYCAEMGERLLVYEYMCHGTLHDHLHGELSPLDWSLRLKISLQAARGLEYLHKVGIPPIIHRDVKTANVLLDSNWEARISGFGLVSVNERDSKGGLENDVYSLGIVLLEILSGRKAFERENMPPGLIEWAVPLIRQGKAAAIIDQSVALPKHVEALLKLAEIAELALEESPSKRPGMSDLVVWLEQIVRRGLIF